MKTPPTEIRPWRDCPFVWGGQYRVRQKFTTARDAFASGEILTFDSDVWSRWDGVTGYFFRQPARETLRVWDLSDDVCIEIWREFFEELPDQPTPSEPPSTRH